MRKFIISVIAVIVFLSILSLFISVDICSAAGDTLHVGSGQPYSKIQDAIDAANESDTVYVHIGTYNENLVIGKTLTLTGEGSGSVIVNGNGDHTIKVYNNSVQISGFTIKNTGETFGCVFLSSVTSCWINNNVVKDGGNGVYLVNSDSNTVKDNIIESNNVGIYLSNSDSNTIQSNTIRDNNANGIFIPSTSNSNNIYINDFDDNKNSNARDEGSNNWDYGSQGNYWDDYNDYDSNEDGIGDNPYIIDGGSGNQDNYPLGNFLSINQQPIAIIDSISPNPSTQGQTVTFNGRGTDDGTIVAWEWKVNDVVISNSKDFEKADFSQGTYTIYFRVQDNDGNWSAYVNEILIVNSQSNKKPTAYIFKPDLDQPVTYGIDVEFRGQGSDPDGGQPTDYYWRSSIDGFLSSSRQFKRNNLTVGTHTIYFKVKDDEGEWSSEVSTTVKIIKDPSSTNNPPVADAGGEYSGYVNKSLTFDGSSSYDPDTGDSISFYSWDFGDGSTGEGVSPQHTYASEGSYTVELTVIDGNGEQNKSITYVSISLSANGQNGGNGKDIVTPGFEVIFVVLATAFILSFRRYKKRGKEKS